MERQRFEGVRVPAPGFPDDTGAVPLHVAAALAAYDADRSRSVDALNAVAGARLLVPVVAVVTGVGEVEHDEAGLASEKSSDMAAVLLTGADGRLALLAFTGTEPLARWRADARPVPVTARQAARAAVQEEAAALLVDVAGPVPFVVEGPTLHALAAPRRPDGS